jgi:bacillolysin
VHEQAGEVRRMNGAYFPTPVLKTLQPTVEQSAAEATVVADLQATLGYNKLGDNNLWQVGGHQIKSELVVFHKNDDAQAEYLAWHVSAFRSVVHKHEYFVDALTGAILHTYGGTCSFDHKHHDLNNEHRTGNIEYRSVATQNSKLDPQNSKPLMDGKDSTFALDLQNVSRRVHSYQVGTRYYMIDASRPMFNAARSVLPNNGVGVVQTFDNRNTDESYYYVSSTNNTWTDKSSVSAHYNAGLSYDYFRATHGRNSINGKGGSVLSFVNVTDGGRSMDNAYWNGEAMFYGNGGQAFRPLAAGLDVAGHEISHGVIQNSANLRYENESGALNESFADIFGIMIDRDDWEVGEDVVLGRNVFPTGLLRSFTNPNNGGTSLQNNGWQPKHTNQQYRGTQDNGGVHINSGITNHAFYLFASNASVTGGNVNAGKVIGERIFYRALTTYLRASSNFLDCRASVEQACKDLYPNNPAYLTALQTAFFQVGIGPAAGSGSGGGNAGGTAYQQNFPINTGSDYIVYVSDDNSKLMLYNPTTMATPTTLSSRGVYNKPSVSDDGSLIVYIGNDRKMYAVSFNWAATPATFNDRVIEPGPTWNNVAISKDGSRIAGNEGDSLIWVFNLGSTTHPSKSFRVFNPTFTQGIDGGVVRETDALEFDHFGEFVMYDAKTEKRVENNLFTFWDIGFIKVWSNTTRNWGDGKIEKMFTDIPENTSVANPTFAKNSAYIVAFDYVDGSGSSLVFQILSANTQTGKLTQAPAGIVTNNVLGYPSFTRTDNRVLFTNESLTGVYQLQTVNISADKLEPAATLGRTTVRNDAQLGNTKDALEKDRIFVAPNPFSDRLTIQITATESSNGSVEITDLLGRTVIRHPLSIATGQNNVDVETRSLTAGVYLMQATFDGKTQTVKVVKQ